MNSVPAAMPSTISVTCSLRADSSVNSCRISVSSIATADTSVKAQRWWRKANSVDMVRQPLFPSDCSRRGSRRNPTRQRHTAMMISAYASKQFKDSVHADQPSFSSGVRTLDACPDCIRRSAEHSAAKRRSEEHTSELQSRLNLVCRLLLEKKKKNKKKQKKKKKKKKKKIKKNT